MTELYKNERKGKRKTTKIRHIYMEQTKKKRQPRGKREQRFKKENITREKQQTTEDQTKLEKL